ncbi:hypothetical protein M501DRAFT_1026451 [Patellaria atrata CBS 101060]|uniref:Prokaryotic-type class I peptide chain release factors domain-containing protein n=1 Tax=Patellaria atrata CBS 101060 TaxID=1346257 RepID=A0A9P4S456_9PEZI|nr:hypothetical protein M501DRAFT_1026451 [Patellaria atrata CBS 101060]
MVEVRLRLKPVSKSCCSACSEEEVSKAREWLEKLDPDTIPKQIGDVSYSRSSGPGGQNVNKVNSKATLRLPLDQLLMHIPKLLHQGIRESRYYVKNSDALIIQADDSRKQRDNEHSCYTRLYSLVAEVGAKTIPGETSQAQRARVQNLQKGANENRLRRKKTHSNKKASRKKAGSEY